MNNNAPTEMLKLSLGNAKLPKSTMIFSLPAGHTCPGAKDCKSSVTVNPTTGKRDITDGPQATFRCYAASAESRLPDTFNLRAHNYALMLPLARKKDVKGMTELILRSMHATGMKKVTAVRVHESGDYFSYSYFAAWMAVATIFPHLKFYSYSKSLTHIVRGKEAGIIPSNFYFTASKGGHFDYLIEPNGFKSVTVTTTKAENDAAIAKGGKFDHDDSLALGDADFFLQIHGQQPAGTETAKYWYTLVKAGTGGYKKGSNAQKGKAKGGKVLKIKRARKDSKSRPLRKAA